jgi:hypothetical protein
MKAGQALPGLRHNLAFIFKLLPVGGGHPLTFLTGIHLDLGSAGKYAPS